MQEVIESWIFHSFIPPSLVFQSPNYLKTRISVLFCVLNENHISPKIHLYMSKYCLPYFKDFFFRTYMRGFSGGTGENYAREDSRRLIFVGKFLLQNCF